MHRKGVIRHGMPYCAVLSILSMVSSAIFCFLDVCVWWLGLKVCAPDTLPWFMWVRKGRNLLCRVFVEMHVDSRGLYSRYHNTIFVESLYQATLVKCWQHHECLVNSICVSGCMYISHECDASYDLGSSAEPTNKAAGVELISNTWLDLVSISADTFGKIRSVLD